MMLVQRFFRANPEVMALLLQGKRLDVDDGLAIECRPSVFLVNMQVFETIEFDCYMEGEEIGSVDHELGGCIMPAEWYCQQKARTFEWTMDQDAAICKLHSVVADRIAELFPSLYERGLFIDAV